MKVILSRKGFDSSFGGYPSPILPDGTMLSMPIPGKSEIPYSDIIYNSVSYSDILAQLSKNKFNEPHCHLDPDIRPCLRKTPVDGWRPAFGQLGTAQSFLEKRVGVGDLFLFFGWFKKTKETKNGYSYMSKKDSSDFYDISDLQVIYGYLQIGEIIQNKDEIRKFTWHPHSGDEYNKEGYKNTLYIPAERLSFAPDLPGYGTFSYDKKFVLTAEHMTRSNWENKNFLTHLVESNRKNCAKDKSKHIQYRGQWQELVVDESHELEEWVKELFK